MSLPADEEKRSTKETSTDADDTPVFRRATTELLFVLLPFIVIGITLGHRGEFRTFLFIPEWSIVSAVIVGQAIAKVTYAAMGTETVKSETVNLFISVLLVCLLVPILVVLSIVLTSPSVSTTLAITQAIFFLLSGTAFWLASAIEHFAEARRKSR